MTEKEKIIQQPHKTVKTIATTLDTLIIIPIIIAQGLNIYNAYKDSEEALQASIQQIYINYTARNYSEMEQDIYNIYPRLQKRKTMKR